MAEKCTPKTLVSNMHARKVLLLCVSFLFKNGLAGNCYIRGVEDTYKNHPVDDFEEKEFYRFEIENVTAVEVVDKYISARLENHQLVIFPSNYFKDYEKDERSVVNPEIHVDLKFNCTEGFSQLLFFQPIRDHNNHDPQFSQDSYRYDLPKSLLVNFDVSSFGDPIVACDIDISNIRLNFSINPPDEFTISYNNTVDDSHKCHRAILKTKNSFNFTFYKNYEITVTDTGIPSRSKTAWLEIYVRPDPRFESAYYTATFYYEAVYLSILLDKPIRLQSGCANIQLMEPKTGLSLFNFNCDSGEITIGFRGAHLQEVFEIDPVMLITIEAKLMYTGTFDRTIVAIRLPKMTNLETVTAETSLETPVKFTRDLYIIKMNAWHESSACCVETVRSFNEPVHYSVDSRGFAKGFPNVRDFYISNPLAAGIYEFTAFAEGYTSKIKTHTRVRLDVTAETVDTQVSGIAFRGDEENEKQMQLYCLCKRCKFIITEQIPESEPRFFFIDDKQTDPLLRSILLDREMDEITNLKVPQFTVLLALSNLACNNETSTIIKQEAKNRQWALISNTKYVQPNQLLISLLFNDSNDNPPIFEIGAKLVVGYPAKELSFKPTYLTKVLATDIDEGKNAAIRYSTSSTHFMIQPKTGKIYLNNIFNDNLFLKFNVTATDKDGRLDGLATDLEIEVKLLEEEHLIVLMFDDFTLEDVDSLIKDLSEEVDLDIKYLTAGVSSTTCVKPEVKYCLKIIAYALSIEGELVKSNQLQKALKNLTILKHHKSERGASRILPCYSGYGSVVVSKYSANKSGNYVRIVATVSVAVVVFVVTFLAIKAYCYFRIYKARKPDITITVEEASNSLANTTTIYLESQISENNADGVRQEEMVEAIILNEARKRV